MSPEVHFAYYFSIESFFRNVLVWSLSGEESQTGYLTESQGSCTWLVYKQCLVHLCCHIPTAWVLLNTEHVELFQHPPVALSFPAHIRILFPTPIQESYSIWGISETVHLGFQLLHPNAQTKYVSYGLSIALPPPLFTLALEYRTPLVGKQLKDHQRQGQEEGDVGWNATCITTSMKWWTPESICIPIVSTVCDFRHNTGWESNCDKAKSFSQLSSIVTL